MANKERKRILLLVTNGFAATNVIHSGLIKQLANTWEIFILSDIIGERELTEINTYFDIILKRIDLKIPRERPLLRLIRKIQKALFFRHFRIETQKIKEQNQKRSFGYLVRLFSGILDFLGLNQLALVSLRKILIRHSTNSKFCSQLDSYNFQGIISSSPLDMRENTIVNSLKRQAKSIAMVISWDNLTSKGVINADHDYVLVWNKFMKTEYELFYGLYEIVPQKIVITGIPRFDGYFESNPDNSLLPKNRKEILYPEKIILFTTSAATHFPTQTEIVQHLEEYAKMNGNCSILVRCHPCDDFSKYALFRNPKYVHVWFPFGPARSEMHSGNSPQLDALTTLKAMLLNCAVCVNVASTIRLDAAACNKPLISIAYDGENDKPYHQSVRRFYDYSHQIPLNKLAVDKMVYSKKELFLALDNILFEPLSPNQSNREKIKEFTHFTTPSAIPTIVNLVEEWLS